jgi:hypothetical protein
MLVKPQECVPTTSNKGKLYINLSARALGTSGGAEFNSLDFHLWGNLETLVYLAPIENGETLHQRISYACQTISNGPGTFESVRQTTLRCVRACID